MSMTLDLLRQRKMEKRGKSTYTSKKIENAVLLELKERLEEYLTDSDRVMIEVNPKVMTEFQNILTDTFLAIYVCEQLDTNKFVFSNRELIF